MPAVEVPSASVTVPSPTAATSVCSRPAPARRGGERRVSARVGGMVVGDVEAEADRRRERGLQPACGAGQQPLDAQPVLEAERVLAVQRLGLVAVARERAA